MSAANEVSPSGVPKPPPATVISQIVSTVDSGEPEDKHCLSHECDVILECKICRNLFRVMNSFLNHKKVHCLQYVVSFTMPLPISKSNDEKTDTDKTEKPTEKTAVAVASKDKSAEAPSPVKEKPVETPSPVKEKPVETPSSAKDSQKTNQTKKSSSSIKSATKSKDAEKGSVSDKNQTKTPATPVKVTASVESSDKMKLRTSRKTEEVKKDASTPKKGDSSKRDSSQPKKGENSGQNQEKSASKKDEKVSKKDITSQKKGDTSSHKKDDVSTTPKKTDSSSQRREERSSRRDSSRESSVSSKKERKDDTPVKKGDSSSHKKDDSSRRGSHKKDDSSIPFRIDKEKKGDKESNSQKKEDGSVPFKKGDKNYSSPKKEESSTRSKKSDSSSQKKEDNSATPKKVDSSSTPKKGDSSIQKKETPSDKSVDSANQKKAEAATPSKKQKTDEPGPSPSKKQAEEPKQKVKATPQKTSTTAKSSEPPTNTSVTPSKTSSSVPPTKSDPASGAKKGDKQADQSKQPVLKKPDPISADNKADEPPVLTPEKVVPSDQTASPKKKSSDATDTLNPLIAGVLDAYQRYKDKNQDSETDEKKSSDEAEAEKTTTNAKSQGEKQKAPASSEKKKKQDKADKNDSEAKKDKVGDAETDDDKHKNLNLEDLEEDGYELKNRLKCPDCDLELTNMGKLAQHMSTHLADSKGHFVCPICQKETRLESFSELILHLRDPHFLKDKQLLPMWRNLMKNCWVDEKDMSATFPVIEAVKHAERGKDNEVPEKNYKCPYCKKKPKILRYFSGLIGHLRSEHGMKKCQLQKMQAKLRKTTEVEVKHKKIKKKCMLFKCSFCFKTFTKKSSIKLHVKTCRKRKEITVVDRNSKKPRGRPKTFTKIVSFKTIGKKKSSPGNSVPPAAGSEAEKLAAAAAAASGVDQSSSISTAVNTPRISGGSFSASNANPDQNFAFTPPTNQVQPVKLETFWVSKTPGKPSECIKSTITNLEKLRTTPSKMFKSSELSKIGNFQCYSCNRYYSFRQHFERHVQLCNHNRKIEEISDFQALRCLECNQTFSYLQHLKRHAAKHLGLDRFKCKMCNYSSYYWSDTKYHLASHKGVNLKHPEFYIENVSCTENVPLTPESGWTPPSRGVKRVADSTPIAGTGTGSVVKTLVLTEQDGMLKVVSDPNQIAKMVNQPGGTPPLKKLRISADASQAPAIIKALPDIQKAVLAPGVKIEKRESTLMPGDLPSPTLQDPTPTTEVFEPAVDPDKEHISWVRKPLKDPDAEPFKWDDDDEGDGEETGNVARASTTNSSSTKPSSGEKSSKNKKPVDSKQASNKGSKSISEAGSKVPVSPDKPVPETFSEPPVLTKEVPIVKSSGVKEKDLKMPLISASNVAYTDASTSQESVVTLTFNDNNEITVYPPEAKSSKGPSGSASSSSSIHSDSASPSATTTNSGNPPVMVSSKDFFSVPHPLSSSPSSSSSSSSHSSISTSTSTSTSTFPYGSPVSPAKVIMMSTKPKSQWDQHHKNTLRRLPNRGLVSTSNLSFPSASRRITKTPIADPVTPAAVSSAMSTTSTSTSTPQQSPTTTAPSTLPSSPPPPTPPQTTGISEK